MATFITLVNFTDQGARAIKDSPGRFDAFKTMAKKHGVEVHSVHWTLGSRDMVIIMSAPDDESMMAAGIAVAMLGNVRTETLRAFDAAGMQGVLSRL
jgi:uncharacterized protein with GYD domain